MQHDVASPALYESHLHSCVVEAMLWAVLSPFLGIPPPHSNGSTWFCCSIQNFGRKRHDLLKLQDPPGSGFLSDYHIPRLVPGLQPPKKCDNPQNARPSVSYLWQKSQRCISNELCFPHAGGSGMNPRSQLMPSAGSSVEIASPFTTASSKAHHKVISKHSSSTVCWLDTWIHSWEMEGHSALCLLSKNRKLLNIDHQSQTDSTTWQKAQQWEGKATGPCHNYIFSFRNCFDVLLTGDNFHFLQTLLKL